MSSKYVKIKKIPQLKSPKIRFKINSKLSSIRIPKIKKINVKIPKLKFSKIKIS